MDIAGGSIHQPLQKRALKCIHDILLRGHAMQVCHPEASLRTPATKRWVRAQRTFKHGRFGLSGSAPQLTGTNGRSLRTSA